jgi:hypothetical protein
VTGIGRSFRGLAAAAGVGLGVGAVVSQAKAAVSAASDLNEQISKTEKVFGASSAAIVKWSDTTATAIGESKRQALTAASSFGALLRPLGVGQQEAADQARRLTQLGADLASFYNTDVQDALDALRSGLVGEVEPLRRYGAVLSETSVQAEAMAETGKKTAASLTPQEKVLARLALIYKQTAIASGDFSDTSGGLANQQRILSAQIDNLASSIGTLLLPKVTELTTQFNDWLANPENKQKVIDGFASGLYDLGKAAEYSAKGMGLLARAFKFLNDINNDPAGAMGPGDIFGGQGLKFPGTRIGAGLRQSFGGGILTVAGIRGLIEGTITSAGRNAVTAARTGQATGGGILDIKKQIESLILPFAGATVARPGATAGQRNTWFDSAIARMLDRTQDIPTLRGQIARLRQIAGLIQERIGATKDVTRRLTLEDNLAEVLRDIRGKQSQIADQAKSVAAARKARQADLEEAMFGWLEFGVRRTELTKGARDDLRALKRLQAAIRDQIKQHGYTLALANRLLDVQLAIADKRKKLDGIGRRATRFTRNDPQQIAAMLGLGGNPRALALLAQVGRGGALPARSGAYAGVVINQAHFYGVQNVSQLENEMRKQARGRAATRRGAR